MSVSVLVVNFRVYDELDGLLGTLEPFLGAGDEVIVVDQDSQPGPLAGLEAKHPRVRFLPRRDNTGFAAGVNFAARHARGEYLLWLNPDVIVREPVPRTLEAWLRDHPEVAVVGPRVLNADGSIQPSARRFPSASTALGGRSTWLTRRFPGNPLSRRNLPAQDAAGPVVVDWVAGACLMTPRARFEALGGLDEAFFLYWEDADYCRRAAARGWHVVYLPTCAVQHAGGRSSDRDSARAIRAFHASAFRMFRKHAGAMGVLLSPFVKAGLWARGELLARRRT
jgi:GT2 family glycosyltransferase